MRSKAIIRITLVFAIIFWVAQFASGLSIIFNSKFGSVTSVPNYFPTFFYFLFSACLFVFFKHRISTTEGLNFTDLLWRVFVTGLLTTIVSLLVKFFFVAFQNNAISKNPIVINLLYQVNSGLIVTFLISTLIVWKRLILYQKSKVLIRTWKYYEYSYIILFSLDFFGYRLGDTEFLIPLVISLLYGLVLSFNLKWVAYLNFRQKWKSLMFIVLVIIYMAYFIDSVFNQNQNPELIIDFSNSLALLSLFGFTFSYSITSFLVVLFNLPTSSVFEGKLKEIISFQRLSQSAPNGKNENEVYEILLESSLSALFAKAGWIEVIDDLTGKTRIFNRNIEKHSILNIKNAIKNGHLKDVMSFNAQENRLKATSLLENIKRQRYKTVLFYPIFIKSKQIGYITLVGDVEDSFNREMIDILGTFINQTSISIENIRLITEALENERYQEELKIASKVQESLLPKDQLKNDHFELAAISMAADEVGGDYYDYFKLSDERYAIVIGDVSGKGTSAAFHMSQVKGIFHSLVQLNLDPKKFLIYANDALGRCLDKNSFVTVSYFIIDTFENTVEFARAGHCPSLYYNNNAKQTVYYKNKGLGLGILRNSSFDKYVQVNELVFSPNDVLLLYTDGVIEATDSNNQQFGYSRLEDGLKRYGELKASRIVEELQSDLVDFCGNIDIDDDYTLVTVKFR